VLEFRSQFEKLEEYLLKESDDAYQQNAFGWCHARCLSTSNWGAFWAERRIQHMTGIMGFAKSGESDTLTAACNPRTGQVNVLRTDGISFTIMPSALDSKKEAILDGMMHFDKALKQEWMGNWVSAIVAYNHFVPQAVVELVTSASTL
jgi:hypothetical protein